MSLQQVAQQAVLLIKQFESFRSTSYHGEQDPINLFTIGYGNTHYENGEAVKLTDNPITEERATQILTFFINQIVNVIDRYVRDDISSNQLVALISFAYNNGVHALRSSTLLRKVNVNPQDTAIRDEFMRWVHVDGGKISNGLVNRRHEEADLYFTP